MVHNNPNALLVRLNREHMKGMPENIKSTISFDEDMAIIINELKNSLKLF